MEYKHSAMVMMVYNICEVSWGIQHVVFEKAKKKAKRWGKNSNIKLVLVFITKFK